MSQKHTLKTIWMICSVIGLASGLFGQDVVVTTTSTCTNESKGEIFLQFDPSLLSDYSLPFTGEWENITTGEYDDFAIVSLDHTISNLEAGEYELTIALNDQCEIFLEVTVISLLTTAISSITPTCICPGPNGYGAVTVQVAGGSGNYAYAWSGSGLSNPNIQNPTVTSTGNFTVTVTDSQTGCEVNGQTTVTNCNVNLPSIVKVTPDCNIAGTSTISIQLPPGYGLAPLQFKWIKIGSGVVETDLSTDGYAAFSGADPGEYCLSVLTMNGCSEQFCGINVVALPSPIIVASATLPNGGANGAISLTVTGQPGPFTYLWSNGMTTDNISGLASGIYCVTVSDATSKCTSTKCVKLLDCAVLQQAIGDIQATVKAITTGGAGGAINITNVQDQFPEYHFNFLWSNGATTEDIKGLASGLYKVTITTADCFGLQMFGEWEVCSFSLKFNLTNFLCNTTTLNVTPSPSGSYSYKWNTGAITQSITANFGTEYCVTVTKLSTGCKASSCVKPALPTLGVSLVDFTNATNGSSDGSITVLGYGGIAFTPPPAYKYKWSNGIISPTINGLAPGTYTVTVTDKCGATVKLTHIIQCEFGQNDMQGIVTNVDCSSNTSGAINLTQLPNVGIPNPVFNYSWSNGATTKNIANLPEGQYCVTLTELTTGCYTTKCFDVNKTGEGNFAIAFDMQPGCFPLNEGSITAIPSSQSQAPYTYSWSTWDWFSPSQNLGNTATINNVPAGWYTVVVTNAVGCTATNFTIMWPGQSPFTVSVQPAGPIIVCKGQKTSVSIQTTSSGGQNPFTYTLANYSTNPITVINNTNPPLSAGNWCVTVTNAYGCQAFTNFSVRESIVKFTSSVDLDCHQGSIKLTPFAGSGSYPPFSYKWDDGSTAKDRTGLAKGSYCVTVKDSKGCTATECFSITHPASLKVFTGANVTQTDCSPTCDGSIDINVNQPASYSWSTGATTQNLSNLCVGSYIVTISSANCIEKHSFTVEENGLRTCGPHWQTPINSFGGSYAYDFFFGRMIAKEVNCFDSSCAGSDDHCSKIFVNKGNGAANPGCWTGKITIDPTDSNVFGPNLVLRIEDGSSQQDNVIWVSGEFEWDVPDPGTYKVVLTYEGDGDSEGDDCVYTLLMNFYGPGNYKDAVGFNDDYWFDMDGVPDNFKDSYFGAWRCETCNAEDKVYCLNNNQNKCEDYGSWLFTFFDYVPINYNRPCAGGGELTILDFDANGNAVIQKTKVLPSSFLDELPDRQPFNSFGNVNTWCTESGWCLFKPDLIYPDANLNKPILATWANPASCRQVVWDEPGQTNPNPCPSTPCPEPLICVDGNCVFPCENDGDCIFGQCVDGECIESNECNPSCPEGYECHEGNCYLDDGICGFKATVNGGGGTSSYLFWHDDIPPGTMLKLKYKTFNIPDEIFVNGASIACVATGNVFVEFPFATVGNSTAVVVNSCGGPSSKFTFEILCDDMLQDGDTSLARSHIAYIKEGSDIVVHPNPFESSLGITIRNVDKPFLGTVDLLDNFGRILKSKEIDFELGNNSLAFDSLGELATGIYSVVVRKEGKIHAFRKVVKIE